MPAWRARNERLAQRLERRRLAAVNVRKGTPCARAAAGVSRTSIAAYRERKRAACRAFHEGASFHLLMPSSLCSASRGASPVVPSGLF
jgi:hypothetical protein